MIYSLLLTTSEQISFEEYLRRCLRRRKLPGSAKDLFPSILRACRLIYQEACPLLYRGNSFYFLEPQTSDTFRWSTDSKYAAWVEEIETTIDAKVWAGYKSGDIERWLKWAKTKSNLNFPRWVEHLGDGRFKFKDNYPHLKRLTISMGDGFLTASTESLRAACQLIGQKIKHLDSVQIIGLNDVAMIELFKSMVKKPTNSQRDRRSVQTTITEVQTRVGWKNVTLWWGLGNGTPPYHTSKPEKNLQRRRRLFRLGEGPDFGYSSGESFVP